MKEMTQTAKYEAAGSGKFVTHYHAGKGGMYGLDRAACGQGNKHRGAGSQALLITTEDWTAVTCSRCLAARTAKAKKGETLVTLTLAEVASVVARAEAEEAARVMGSFYDSGVLARELKRAARKATEAASDTVTVALKPVGLRLLTRHLGECA